MALLIALVSVGTATFAWYIYNTNAHTTKVSVAAGSSGSLLIYNPETQEYAYSAKIEPFYGRLNPVSTNKISNGFKEVTEFRQASGSETKLEAYLFGDAPEKDYYTTDLKLKSTAGNTDVYISDILFQDSDKDKPISSAMRLGLQVFKPGSETEVENEYIFEITDESGAKHVQNPDYNTWTGVDGHVLNTNPGAEPNSTIEFHPLTRDNYCEINEETGDVIVKEGLSKLICTCGETPVKIKLYFWLEGCDADCTLDLLGATLKDVAINFAGVFKE